MTPSRTSTEPSITSSAKTILALPSANSLIDRLPIEQEIAEAYEWRPCYRLVEQHESVQYRLGLGQRTEMRRSDTRIGLALDLGQPVGQRHVKAKLLEH